MEVYLVRHTETVCEKGICYGQSDVQLLEPYLELFETIKNQVPTDAVVYSSPLFRCTELAHYVSSSSIRTDSRLMEMNFGDWEMKSWDAIAPDDFAPWMNDFVNVAVPNGESFVDLYHRVDDFLENELQNTISKPVVIVAHAGVIRSILCKISNLPLKDAFQNQVNFGAVIKIEL
ncbi:alpha-ribazole phosphatase [Flavobacterium granuli]|uniref:Alpha-ribazole phosphatase n=1 Tax=Flavobacterium granuli TaxID=280093 RepID=A0A1M5IZ01_9FLAO|nr:alpha-ribazole phosphatase [Flavobacterium granuli]PRZ28168.1 alpha-ribazole phosphatase [Flavobacterium granuli]SHG33534.1 alpha-ribazole phosphatase [Flavobacterium granuli]